MAERLGSLILCPWYEPHNTQWEMLQRGKVLVKLLAGGEFLEGLYFKMAHVNYTG